MYIYTTTNPCLCNPLNPPPPPGCPDVCNCLKLCHITVNANSNEAVGPCAATGTINVMDEKYNHDTCVCGESPLRWSMEGFDSEIFISARITSAGVLTWVTQGPQALEKQYGCITLKACCGEVAAYMMVIIGIKDLCNCPDCEVCEICDPCTGLCAEAQANASISNVVQNSNLSL